MLALTTAPTPMEFQDVYGHPRPGYFDPSGVQAFLRPGPQSDAGFHRGDHESSQISEEEAIESVSRAREARVVRHNVAGSDASIDFNNSNPTLSGNSLPGTMPVYDSAHSNGLQSRLTRDILNFVSANTVALRKLDGKRKMAVERFSRLVKTIWPRAQVKLYGSYMSGLCLTSRYASSCFGT